MPRKVKITVGEVELEAELFETECAQAVAGRLPISCGFSTWGDEIYFVVPLARNRDETATCEVEIGTIAYWPVGRAVCIFFGPTPMSCNRKPVPADRVNIIGRVLGDAEKLRRVKGAGHLEMQVVEEE
jgi:hypothetical protein